jgi:hypothetical protein
MVLLDPGLIGMSSFSIVDPTILTGNVYVSGVSMLRSSIKG